MRAQHKELGAAEETKKTPTCSLSLRAFDRSIVFLMKSGTVATNTRLLTFWFFLVFFGGAYAVSSLQSTCMVFFDAA